MFYFVELPNLNHLVLPWGERIVDLGTGQRSPWFLPGVAGSIAALAYAAYAAARQYRSGDRRRATMLGLALLVFVPLLVVNFLVNFGLLTSVHTAQFGFIALVLVMNQELGRERRQQRLRKQAILDSVPAIVYMKDLDGRYILSNRRYEELLHALPGSIVGKTDHDLFPAPRAQVFRANDRLVVERREALAFEEVTEVDGEPRTYVSHKFPQFDSAGCVDAVSGVSLDVTDSRKAEVAMDLLRRQVWHADRVERIGALAASLAHEISQPLTAILANAQAALRFLDRDEADLGEVRECLQEIVRDDKRASGVINGLRAMLRRQDAPREPVDLGQCIGEVLDLMHAEFEARGIDVRRSVTDGPTVDAYKPQIQQVLLNLLLNACEAMAEIAPNERLLTVSVTAEAEGQVRVSVGDRGAGLADDQLGQVFNGFYTTKPQGLGIGLAVCRSIVEAHGGTIAVARNEEPGGHLLLHAALRQPRAAS